MQRPRCLGSGYLEINAFREDFRCWRHAQRALGRGGNSSHIRSLPNAILVGNLAMAPSTRTTQREVSRPTHRLSNKVLVNPGVGYVFGGGGPGDPTLFISRLEGQPTQFPAGGSTTSVFASLVPAAASQSRFF